jgi:uncharacterized protein (DUF2336 family)
VSDIAASVVEFAEAVAAKDDGARLATANRITDLFVAHAPSFSESHIELFEQVIGLLADAIEVRARARLSDRLADVPNAPSGVIRRFAKDDIAVARPVLARSPQLTEADLIDAARSRGRDHMLAISERRDLSEKVTDVLVGEGDRVVVNAVASNPTARFSDLTYDTLVNRSGDDELLQAAIARRRDIPQRHMVVLFELAKKAARERLQAEIAQVSRRAVREAVNSSARDIAAETIAMSDAYKAAVADVTALMNKGQLNDGAVLEYARRGQTAHVVCGLAALGKVPVSLPERAVTAGDHDLLLILAKSMDLTWPTVRAILCLRKEQKPGPRQFDQFSESYAKLAPQTAERLLRYLHAREAVSAKR